MLIWYSFLAATDKYIFITPVSGACLISFTTPIRGPMISLVPLNIAPLLLEKMTPPNIAINQVDVHEWKYYSY